MNAFKPSPIVAVLVLFCMCSCGKPDEGRYQAVDARGVPLVLDKKTGKMASAFPFSEPVVPGTTIPESQVEWRIRAAFSAFESLKRFGITPGEPCAVIDSYRKDGEFLYTWVYSRGRVLVPAPRSDRSSAFGDGWVPPTNVLAQALAVMSQESAVPPVQNDLLDFLRRP